MSCSAELSMQKSFITSGPDGFPIHINTISIKLSFLAYFKESQIYFSKV